VADFAGTTRERHEELVASEMVAAANRPASNDNREEPVDWLGDPLLTQLARIEIAATRCW
jgi:hypothetical protein